MRDENLKHEEEEEKHVYQIWFSPLFQIKKTIECKPNSRSRGYIASNIKPTYQDSDKSSLRISLIWPPPLDRYGLSR